MFFSLTSESLDGNDKKSFYLTVQMYIASLLTLLLH